MIFEIDKRKEKSSVDKKITFEHALVELEDVKAFSGLLEVKIKISCDFEIYEFTSKCSRRLQQHFMS